MRANTRAGSAKPDDLGVSPDAAPGAPARSAAHRIDWAAARAAERSCCCSAKPAVVVVLPPASGLNHQTELLMCMHHFRNSANGLITAGWQRSTWTAN
jgi:hypothetical protein